MAGGARVAVDDECKVIGYFFLIPLGVLRGGLPRTASFFSGTPSQNPQHLLLQQFLLRADEILGDFRDNGIPQALAQTAAQLGQ